MTELYEGAAETGELSGEPWRDVPREEAQWMRPHLPALVDSMVEGVLRHVPEYARPDDPVYTETIRVAIERGMGHFVQMIADPDVSWKEVHQVFFDVGYGEAMEGRSLEHLQNALRVASRTAWRYLSREADRLQKPRELAIALDGRGVPHPSIHPSAGRNCADSAAHRFLGGVRRKPRAHHRTLAYLGSDGILPIYGTGLDHPVETVGSLDPDRQVQAAAE